MVSSHANKIFLLIGERVNRGDNLRKGSLKNLGSKGTGTNEPAITGVVL